LYQPQNYLYIVSPWLLLPFVLLISKFHFILCYLPSPLFYLRDVVPCCVLFNFIINFKFPACLLSTLSFPQVYLFLVSSRRAYQAKGSLYLFLLSIIQHSCRIITWFLIFNPFKPKLIYIIFNNSVPTTKKNMSP
jgi:hypothetical protein